MAIDPSRPDRLVVGLTFDNACWVRRSIDGGRTWGNAVPLPRRPETWCDDGITLNYASDGSQLYAAYEYYDGEANMGIALTTSYDHGATWSEPTVKLIPELASNCYSLESAVSPDDSRSVYLTAICNSGIKYMYFARIDGDDLSWDLFSTLANLDGQHVSGPHLAAAAGGAILVTFGKLVKDEVAVVVVARSSDRGNSFVRENATAPFRFSSESFYPDPDIAIDSSGKAHLVYIRSMGSSLAVAYLTSMPPYKTWSTRARRLDDADGAQDVTGSPRITASTCEDTSILHVSWGESRVAGAPEEDRHKILYTRKLEQASSWSNPLTVTETTGDVGPALVDLAAGRGNAFPIFGIFSLISYKTQIAGSRVWSGVTCRW